MILLCRVCAEFYAPDGTLLHKVGMKERLVPHEAPDNITIDPLFTMLVSDGTISYVSSKEDQKKLEQMDPTAGIDASGKRIQPEMENSDAEAESAGYADKSENAGSTEKPGTAGMTEATGTDEADMTSEASVKKETKTTGRTRKTGGE